MSSVVYNLCSANTTGLTWTMAGVVEDPCGNTPSTSTLPSITVSGGSVTPVAYSSTIVSCSNGTKIATNGSTITVDVVFNEVISTRVGTPTISITAQKRYETSNTTISSLFTYNAGAQPDGYTVRLQAVADADYNLCTVVINSVTIPVGFLGPCSAAVSNPSPTPLTYTLSGTAVSTNFSNVSMSTCTSITSGSTNIGVGQKVYFTIDVDNTVSFTGTGTLTSSMNFVMNGTTYVATNNTPFLTGNRYLNYVYTNNTAGTVTWYTPTSVTVLQNTGTGNTNGTFTDACNVALNGSGNWVPTVTAYTLASATATTLQSVVITSSTATRFLRANDVATFTLNFTQPTKTNGTSGSTTTTLQFQVENAPVETLQSSSAVGTYSNAVPFTYTAVNDIDLCTTLNFQIVSNGLVDVCGVALSSIGAIANGLINKSAFDCTNGAAELSTVTLNTSNTFSIIPNGGTFNLSCLFTQVVTYPYTPGTATIPIGGMKYIDGTSVGTVNASYVSGSGTTTLLFRYTNNTGNSINVTLASFNNTIITVSPANAIANSFGLPAQIDDYTLVISYTNPPATFNSMTVVSTSASSQLIPNGGTATLRVYATDSIAAVNSPPTASGTVVLEKDPLTTTTNVSFSYSSFASNYLVFTYTNGTGYDVDACNVTVTSLTNLSGVLDSASVAFEATVPIAGTYAGAHTQITSTAVNADANTVATSNSNVVSNGAVILISVDFNGAIALPSGSALPTINFTMNKLKDSSATPFSVNVAALNASVSSGSYSFAAATTRLNASYTYSGSDSFNFCTFAVSGINFGDTRDRCGQTLTYTPLTAALAYPFSPNGTTLTITSITASTNQNKTVAFAGDTIYIDVGYSDVFGTVAGTPTLQAQMKQVKSTTYSSLGTLNGAQLGSNGTIRFSYTLGGGDVALNLCTLNVQTVNSASYAGLCNASIDNSARPAVTVSATINVPTNCTDLNIASCTTPTIAPNQTVFFTLTFDNTVTYTAGSGSPNMTFKLAPAGTTFTAVPNAYTTFLTDNSVLHFQWTNTSGGTQTASTLYSIALVNDATHGFYADACGNTISTAAPSSFSATTVPTANISNTLTTSTGSRFIVAGQTATLTMLFSQPVRVPATYTATLHGQASADPTENITSNTITGATAYDTSLAFTFTATHDLDACTITNLYVTGSVQDVCGVTLPLPGGSGSYIASVTQGFSGNCTVPAAQLQSIEVSTANTVVPNTTGTIEFHVTFSQNVYVGTNPGDEVYIPIQVRDTQTGATHASNVSYSAGSGTNTLTFMYTNTTGVSVNACTVTLSDPAVVASPKATALVNVDNLPVVIDSYTRTNVYTTIATTSVSAIAIQTVDTAPAAQNLVETGDSITLRVTFSDVIATNGSPAPTISANIVAESNLMTAPTGIAFTITAVNQNYMDFSWTNNTVPATTYNVCTLALTNNLTATGYLDFCGNAVNTNISAITPTYTQTKAAVSANAIAAAVASSSSNNIVTQNDTVIASVTCTGALLQTASTFPTLTFSLNALGTTSSTNFSVTCAGLNAAVNAGAYSYAAATNNINFTYVMPTGATQYNFCTFQFVSLTMGTVQDRCQQSVNTTPLASATPALNYPAVANVTPTAIAISSSGTSILADVTYSDVVNTNSGTPTISAAAAKAKGTATYSLPLSYSAKTAANQLRFSYTVPSTTFVGSFSAAAQTINYVSGTTPTVGATITATGLAPDTHVIAVSGSNVTIAPATNAASGGNVTINTLTESWNLCTATVSGISTSNWTGICNANIVNTPIPTLTKPTNTNTFLDNVNVSTCSTGNLQLLQPGEVVYFTMTFDNTLTFDTSTGTNSSMLFVFNGTAPARTAVKSAIPGQSFITAASVLHYQWTNDTAGVIDARHPDNFVLATSGGVTGNGVVRNACATALDNTILPLNGYTYTTSVENTQLVAFTISNVTTPNSRYLYAAQTATLSLSFTQPVATVQVGPTPGVTQLNFNVPHTPTENFTLTNNDATYSNTVTFTFTPTYDIDLCTITNAYVTNTGNAKLRDICGVDAPVPSGSPYINAALYVRNFDCTGVAAELQIINVLTVPTPMSVNASAVVPNGGQINFGAVFSANVTANVSGGNYIRIPISVMGSDGLTYGPLYANFVTMNTDTNMTLAYINSTGVAVNACSLQYQSPVIEVFQKSSALLTSSNSTQVIIDAYNLNNMFTIKNTYITNITYTTNSGSQLLADGQILTVTLYYNDVVKYTTTPPSITLTIKPESSNTATSITATLVNAANTYSSIYTYTYTNPNSLNVYNACTANVSAVSNGTLIDLCNNAPLTTIANKHFYATFTSGTSTMTWVWNSADTDVVIPSVGSMVVVEPGLTNPNTAIVKAVSGSTITIDRTLQMTLASPLYIRVDPIKSFKSFYATFNSGVTTPITVTSGASTVPTVGQLVTGSGIPSDSFVTVVSGTTLTLNNATTTQWTAPNYLDAVNPVAPKTSGSTAYRVASSSNNNIVGANSKIILQLEFTGALQMNSTAATLSFTLKALKSTSPTTFTATAVNLGTPVYANYNFVANISSGGVFTVTSGSMPTVGNDITSAATGVRNVASVSGSTFTVTPAYNTPQTGVAFTGTRYAYGAGYSKLNFEYTISGSDTNQYNLCTFATGTLTPNSLQDRCGNTVQSWYFLASFASGANSLSVKAGEIPPLFSILSGPGIATGAISLTYTAPNLAIAPSTTAAASAPVRINYTPKPTSVQFDAYANTNISSITVTSSSGTQYATSPNTVTIDFAYSDTIDGGGRANPDFALYIKKKGGTTINAMFTTFTGQIAPNVLRFTWTVPNNGSTYNVCTMYQWYYNCSWYDPCTRDVVNTPLVFTPSYISYSALTVVSPTYQTCDTLVRDGQIVRFALPFSDVVSISNADTKPNLTFQVGGSTNFTALPEDGAFVANFANNSNTLTFISGFKPAVGYVLVGTGIANNTTVTNVANNTITVNLNTTATVTGGNVSAPNSAFITGANTLNFKLTNTAGSSNFDNTNTFVLSNGNVKDPCGQSVSVAGMSTPTLNTQATQLLSLVINNVSDPGIRFLYTGQTATYTAYFSQPVFSHNGGDIYLNINYGGSNVAVLISSSVAALSLTWTYTSTALIDLCAGTNYYFSYGTGSPYIEDVCNVKVIVPEGSGTYLSSSSIVQNYDCSAVVAALQSITVANAATPSLTSSFPFYATFTANVTVQGTTLGVTNTSGTSTLTLTSGSAPAVGAFLSGNGIRPGTKVQFVVGTQISISQNTTADVNTVYAQPNLYDTQIQFSAETSQGVTETGLLAYYAAGTGSNTLTFQYDRPNGADPINLCTLVITNFIVSPSMAIYTSSGAVIIGSYSRTNAYVGATTYVSQIVKSASTGNNRLTPSATLTVDLVYNDVINSRAFAAPVLVVRVKALKSAASYDNITLTYVPPSPSETEDVNVVRFRASNGSANTYNLCTLQMVSLSISFTDLCGATISNDVSTAPINFTPGTVYVNTTVSDVTKSSSSSNDRLATTNTLTIDVAFDDVIVANGPSPTLDANAYALRATTTTSLPLTFASLPNAYTMRFTWTNNTPQTYNLCTLYMNTTTALASNYLDECNRAVVNTLPNSTGTFPSAGFNYVDTTVSTIVKYSDTIPNTQNRVYNTQTAVIDVQFDDAILQSGTPSLLAQTRILRNTSNTSVILNYNAATQPNNYTVRFTFTSSGPTYNLCTLALSNLVVAACTDRCGRALNNNIASVTPAFPSSNFVYVDTTVSTLQVTNASVNASRLAPTNVAYFDVAFDDILQNPAVPPANATLQAQAYALRSLSRSNLSPAAADFALLNAYTLRFTYTNGTASTFNLCVQTPANANGSLVFANLNTNYIDACGNALNTTLPNTPVLLSNVVNTSITSVEKRSSNGTDRLPNAAYLELDIFFDDTIFNNGTPSITAQAYALRNTSSITTLNCPFNNFDGNYLLSFRGQNLNAETFNLCTLQLSALNLASYTDRCNQSPNNTLVAPHFPGYVSYVAATVSSVTKSSSSNNDRLAQNDTLTVDLLYDDAIAPSVDTPTLLAQAFALQVQGAINIATLPVAYNSMPNDYTVRFTWTNNIPIATTYNLCTLQISNSVCNFTDRCNTPVNASVAAVTPAFPVAPFAYVLASVTNVLVQSADNVLFVSSNATISATFDDIVAQVTAPSSFTLAFQAQPVAQTYYDTLTATYTNVNANGYVVNFSVTNNAAAVATFNGTVQPGGMTVLVSGSLPPALQVQQKLNAAGFASGTTVAYIDNSTNVITLQTNTPATVTGSPVAINAYKQYNLCSARNAVLNMTPSNALQDRCGSQLNLAVAAGALTQSFGAYTQPQLLSAIIWSPRNNYLPVGMSATITLNYSDLVHLNGGSGPTLQLSCTACQDAVLYNVTNGVYDGSHDAVFTFTNNTLAPVNLCTIDVMQVVDANTVYDSCNLNNVTVPTPVPFTLDWNRLAYPQSITTLNSLTLNAAASRLDPTVSCTFAAVFSDWVYKATPASLLTLSFQLNGSVNAVANMTSIDHDTIYYQYTNNTASPLNLCTATNYAFSTNIVDDCDANVVIAYPVSATHNFPLSLTEMTSLTVSAVSNLVRKNDTVQFTTHFNDTVVTGTETVTMLVTGRVVTNTVDTTNVITVTQGSEYLAVGLTLESDVAGPLPINGALIVSIAGALVTLSAPVAGTYTGLALNVAFTSTVATIAGTDTVASYTMPVVYTLNLCSVSTYRINQSGFTDLCAQTVDFPPVFPVTESFPILPTYTHRVVVSAATSSLAPGETATAALEFTAPIYEQTGAPAFSLVFNLFTAVNYTFSQDAIVFTYTNTGASAINLCTLSAPTLTPSAPVAPGAPWIVDDCDADAIVLNPIPVESNFVASSSVSATGYLVSAASSALLPGGVVTFTATLSGLAHKETPASTILLQFVLNGVTRSTTSGSVVNTSPTASAAVFTWTNSTGVAQNLCLISAVTLDPTHILDDCNQTILVPAGLPIYANYPIAVTNLRDVRLEADSGSSSVVTFRVAFTDQVVGQGAVVANIGGTVYTIPGNNATLSSTLLCTLNAAPATLNLCSTVLLGFNTDTLKDPCDSTPNVPTPITFYNPYSSVTFNYVQLVANADIVPPLGTVQFRIQFTGAVTLTPGAFITAVGAFSGFPFSANNTTADGSRVTITYTNNTSDEINVCSVTGFHLTPSSPNAVVDECGGNVAIPYTPALRNPFSCTNGGGGGAEAATAVIQAYAALLYGQTSEEQNRNAKTSARSGLTFTLPTHINLRKRALVARR